MFTGKVTTLPFYHANQADLPNATFGTSAALKAALDSATIAIQNEINGLIDQLNSIVALSSGADNVGSAPIAGVTGITVHDQLNSLYGLYAGIISGITPTYVVPADTAFKFASNITETLSSSTGSLDFKEI